MCIMKTGIWSVKMLPQKWQLLSTTRWQLGIKTVVEMPAYGRWESCISSENFWSIIRLHCLLGINAFLMLSQVLTYNGFYDSNLEFVSLDNVQIVASMNSGNSLGRHQLTSRFTSIVRLCSIGYALACICFTFSDFVMQKTFYSWFLNVPFSALTLLVGRHEEHPACTNWVMGCWCGYLSGARWSLFAYGLTNDTAFPKPHHLLSHLNPDWFYLSGTVLPRLSWKRGCLVK